MISIELIEKAAKRLRDADLNKEVCDPIRDIIGTTDVATAYSVQKINSDLRKKSGARIVGHKIGLTAPVVQKQLGVNQPDFGLLWHDKEVLNGGEISMTELMQPKVEAEIAFVLGRDLDIVHMTSVDILRAVEYAVPSIEIVGSRIRDWDIKITDTVADNASASHWVIGHRPIKLDQLDLINCKMRMEDKGDVVSQGIGKACLGSPINALLWLAKKMMDLGSPLRAGDLILSGAVGPMVSVSGENDISASIDGLGSVSVSFRL